MKKRLIIIFASIFIIAMTAFFAFGDGDSFFGGGTGGITPGSNATLNTANITTLNTAGANITGGTANLDLLTSMNVDLTAANLNQPATTYAGANVYGFLHKNTILNGNSGGLLWGGFTNDDHIPLTAFGIIGTNGTPTSPAYLLWANKMGVGTNVVALGNTDMAEEVATGIGQILRTLYGNGDETITGMFTAPTLNTAGANITGGNISLTNITVNDFLYMSVDAGIDTPYAPSAATKIQGNVTAITAGNVTAANGTYTTFTPVAGGNITAAASAAGANATLTFSNMTVGRVVHHQFTPTLTSGSVPTLTVTSGATLSSLCTFANATICDSYFIPTSANVVLTITTAGAANFVIASSSTYEYSRAAIGRDFSHTTAQTLLYDIYFPYDWDAGNVYAKLFNVIDQSSAPAANNTVIYQIGGFCVGTNDSLDQTMGTGVNATFTAGANMAQYQEVITNESGAITLNNAGAGKKCRMEVRRLTTDTYTQPIALTGMRIRFRRVMNGTYTGN